MPVVPAAVPGPPILETTRCENPWRCSYNIGSHRSAACKTGCGGLHRHRIRCTHRIAATRCNVKYPAALVMQIIGRAALVETLTAHALAGHAVLVHGPRGIGASTLLDA